MTQAEALAILRSGAHVFLTGEAGSGKTHTIKKCGANRVMQGSDYPFPLGEAIPGELVHKTPMSDKEKELVFSGAAKEWLGI